MTPEIWIAGSVPTITALYAVYRAGQTNDDRTKGLIKSELENSEKLKAAERAATDLQFQHMAGDISRMNDSISEILRMIREGIATKQDMAHIEFRLDALETSSTEHYGSFKAIQSSIADMKVRCANHHRQQAGASSSFPRDQVR